MRNETDVQIRSIIEMADRMIVISEKGFAHCVDDGCLLLNGMVRESAYRIRDAAERERKVHETEWHPAVEEGKGRRPGQKKV